MDDPYAELARVKARVKELEAYAAAQPPSAPRLGDALADAMSPPRPPVDRKARDLANRAHGFVPDLQSEAALEARAADPERFDRDYRAMGGDGLALALYAEQKVAHETLAKETK